MNAAHLDKPHAIFFDWDGTLVDSFSMLEAAHNTVLQSYDMPAFEAGGFKRYFGKPRAFIYTDLYGDDRAEEARMRFDEFITRNHTDVLEPMAGAKTLLERIEKLGIVMGVVSNKKPEFVNAEVDHFGWRKYFKAVVGSTEAPEDKPSCAPLRLGYKRTGLTDDLKNVWYVGDTIMDLLCAQNAGSPCVFITNDEPLPEEIRAKNPTMVMRNCTEFADFLLQYEEK